MSTTTNTDIESSLKNKISQKQGYVLQKKVARLVDNYIENCNDGNRIPTRNLVLELLGGDAHLAEDEAYYMREVFLGLLVFLADPKITKALHKSEFSYSDKCAAYIRRVIDFALDANNSLAYAEMAKGQMEYGYVDDRRLEMWEKQYSKLLGI